MPSEVILPSVAATLVLMIMASMFVGALVYSTAVLHGALKDYVDILARSKLNRVVLTNATVLSVVEIGPGLHRVEFRIYVYNDGQDTIYAMEKCDLMVQYHTVSGDVRVVRLLYGVDWFVEGVIIVDDYLVNPSTTPAIGPSETGVVKGNFIAENIDTSRPVKVIFASHYGYTATRWLVLGS